MHVWLMNRENYRKLILTHLISNYKLLINSYKEGTHLELDKCSIYEGTRKNLKFQQVNLTFSSNLALAVVVL